MAAELILMLDEPQANDKEKMLIHSHKEEICVIVATTICMRQDLNRNNGFFEVIVSLRKCTPSKFKSNYLPFP